MKLYIDNNKTFQTMRGFGVSGAWWAQSVGKWTALCPDGTPVKDKIAKLLFNRAEGIGIDTAVDVHSYFLKDSLPFSGDRPAYLRRFKNWMDRRYPGTEIKVSEWCHMQGGKNTGIDSALVQAGVMLEDLTILSASSFSGWIACSPYDYCDGLIYIDPENESFELTKRYFAFGNFSKYIPSGAVRVASITDDKDVMTAAFKTGDKLIFIILNPSAGEKELRLKSGGTLFVTDTERDLEKQEFKEGETIRINSFSVNTLLINLENTGKTC